MSWETRRGRRYYYRARKVGSRVVKEYVGVGPLAEVVAAQDARQRGECLAIAEARRVEHGHLAAVDATVDVSHEDIETLLRANLILGGYHRHHRGEWRRRRDG